MNPEDAKILASLVERYGAAQTLKTIADVFADPKVKRRNAETALVSWCVAVDLVIDVANWIENNSYIW